MPKFTITTLGCKVNQYESEAMAQYLKSSGWAQVLCRENADLCIINTCTVTQKASMQSRQAIRQAIRSHPKARIIVTGCYVQIEPEEIKKIKGVHNIVGHGDKHKIPGMIISSDIKHHPPCPVTLHRDIKQEYDFKQIPGLVSGNRTRPYLKIQDGCDDFCTYCIVPYARGPGRSMPPENVIDKISKLKDAGYHEVVLSGIHLGSYGLDLLPETNLAKLLKKIHEVKAIDRIRLSSIEPHELTEDIINLIAESGVFCHHFHIPLQSGDDHILKKMHRPYTNAFFRELVFKIHELIPDAAIGVDILIGFPGETQSAFENTYKLIKELPVTYLHVFPFSSRKGTPAGKMPDKVHSKVIKERCQKIRTLGNIKKREYYKKFIDKRIEVLIEGKKDRANNILKGITSNYVPVLLKREENLENKIVKVEIKGLNSNNLLFGNIL